MVKVTIDIAGYYYREVVEVPEGATVQTAMKEAEKLESFPKLKITTETFKEKLFLDSITVTHSGGSAESGQTKNEPVKRTYPDGIYSGADDAVQVSEDGTQLIAVDQNATSVNAWQYYIYDKDSVDLNRKAGTRRIVPFSEVFDIDGEMRGLKDKDVIVWRQITIRTRPNGPLGPKLESAKMDALIS